MVQYFKNLLLWKKIVLVGVIPLLVISILVGVLSYRHTEQAVREAGKNSLADSVNRIDLSLTVRTRQLNSALQSIVASLPQGDGVSALFQTGAFQALLQPFQEIQSIAVLREEELVYASSPAGAIDTSRLPQLYAQARTDKTVYLGLTESLLVPDQPPVLLVLQKIQDDGLLLLELDPTAAGSTLLSKQRIFRHQTSLLVARDFQIIYSDNAVAPELIGLLQQAYKAGRRLMTVTYDGKDYDCYAQDNGLLGWVTLSLIQEEHLFPSSASLQHYIVVLVLVCVLAAWAFLMILSRIITGPLARLSDGMRQVQGENFHIHLQNDRADEIGELTDSFNFMVEQIRTLIDQVYQQELAQKSAELESLQAQINPHFLYNTLDSINWMLIDRGEMDISAIVVALGKLMQYSMDTSTSLVPLQEEYRNARDFLMVQKNRLEDQLEYELLLEPGLEDFRVPKLILQPLIENSIKYGIVRSGRQGKVTVDTIRQGDHICITIQDDGTGMDAPQLAACRRLLENDRDGQRSIGIRNVARRLQLHFDHRCGFSIDSAAGQGTTLRLVLPMIERE